MTNFPYQSTYILVNFFTVIVCFIFSFHPKIQFSAHFKAFLKASLLVAIPFIPWDMWFTANGVWWFDEQYTLGISILNLPIEECLFFICIPFSCLFTYYTLDKFFRWEWANTFNQIFIVTYAALMLYVSIRYHNQIYTFVTATLSLVTMVLFYLLLKPNWVFKAFLIYLILMLGFFPVNGILTGSGLPSPVVNYNTDEIINIRLWTIPIEDTAYGFLLILWNLWWFQYFDRDTEISKVINMKVQESNTSS